MEHDSTLITTFVMGLVLAFVLGPVANRLRISLLVGYLLAGVAVGPFTPRPERTGRGSEMSKNALEF